MHRRSHWALHTALLRHVLCYRAVPAAPHRNPRVKKWKRRGWTDTRGRSLLVGSDFSEGNLPYLSSLANGTLHGKNAPGPTAGFERFSQSLVRQHAPIAAATE